MISKAVNTQLYSNQIGIKSKNSRNSTYKFQPKSSNRNSHEPDSSQWNKPCSRQLFRIRKQLIDSCYIDATTTNYQFDVDEDDPFHSTCDFDFRNLSSLWIKNRFWWPFKWPFGYKYINHIILTMWFQLKLWYLWPDKPFVYPVTVVLRSGNHHFNQL